MNPKMALVKLTICGPSDVEREVGAAQEVIYDWNRQHGEANGFWVKHQHWSSDAHPSLAGRAQSVINHQLIDDSDILVAIFWSRLGTPTGVADSGTQEEILRGVRLGKKVLVYFSRLEPLPADADAEQIDRLDGFRQDLQAKGLCWSFTSRAQFRKDFTNHLALALNACKQPAPPNPSPRKAQRRNHQTLNGNNNVQLSGDGNTVTVNHRPPVQKTIVERRPGTITADEEHQINSWIEDLAEGDVTSSRSSAFGAWRQRFYNRFKVVRAADVASEAMPDIKAWYVQQRAIQRNGYKSSAPELYRTEKTKAIKTAMASMGFTEETKLTYYHALSSRLKMRRPFTSLKQLTTRNLGRVYSMALRDSRGKRG